MILLYITLTLKEAYLLENLFVFYISEVYIENESFELFQFEFSFLIPNQINITAQMYTVKVTNHNFKYRNSLPIDFQEKNYLVKKEEFFGLDKQTILLEYKMMENISKSINELDDRCKLEFLSFDDFEWPKITLICNNCDLEAIRSDDPDQTTFNDLTKLVSSCIKTATQTETATQKPFLLPIKLFLALLFFLVTFVFLILAIITYNRFK